MPDPDDLRFPRCPLCRCKSGPWHGLRCLRPVQTNPYEPPAPCGCPSSWTEEIA